MSWGDEWNQNIWTGRRRPLLMALIHHPKQKPKPYQWPTLERMVFTTNTRPCSCAPKINFIIQIYVQQPLAFFFFLQIWLVHNIYFTKVYMCILFSTCLSCFNFCMLTTIILPKVCLNACECVWVCLCVCKIYHELYNFWGLISLNIMPWSTHFDVITFVHSFLTAP